MSGVSFTDYNYGYVDDHSTMQNPYSNVPNPTSRRKFVDTHELLKKEMFEQTGSAALGDAISQAGDDIFGPTSLPYGQGKEQKKEESSVPGPLSIANEGIIDRFIYFDSDAKNNGASNLAGGVISWPVSVLNQNKPIDNIIQMEIYTFYIPEIDTGINFPQYYFYKRVTILLQEMQTTAILAQSNIRFHFEMEVQPAGIANLLQPANNWTSVFTFSKPFIEISLASFQFRAPIKTLEFPQDIYDYVSVAGSNPARIQTIGDHGITIGGQVSIFSRDFASNVGNIDALINSPDGQLLTAITSTILEFPASGIVGFDFSGVGVVQGNLTIGYRRVAFTMRFRSITDERTNRIVPV